MEKRKYQDKVVGRLLSIVKTLFRAFLEMPTGTGKTITAFKFILKLFGNAKKPITITWAVHQKQLVYQAYCDFIIEVAELPIDNIELGQSVYFHKHDHITVMFTTWQTLRKQNIVSDLLIIDECHKGSSLANADEKREHKSFHAIFKLAPKHLYISATPWTLDSELFPDMLITYMREGKVQNTVKEEYKAVYSRTDAARDKYIANVRFFAVQSADTLKIQNLNEEELLQFQSLEEGARRVENRKVNLKHLKSRRALNQSIRDSVLHNFFVNEVVGGQLRSPAMVICQPRYKSGDHTLCAKEMAKEIKLWARHHLGPKHVTGKTFVDYVTGDLKDKDEKIEKFKRGEIQILCVVGMLKEGFNYEELGAMVDFAPCFDTNVRDATQRMGRPARPYKGKLFARYYYPDVIQNYINHMGVKKDLDNNKASSHCANLIASQTGRDQEEITEEEIQAAKNSIMRLSKLKDDTKASTEDGEIAFKNQTLVTGKLSLKKDKVQSYISTEIDFIIIDADNTNPEANIKVQDLYEMLSVKSGSHDPEGNKQAIKDFYNKNKKFPSTYAIDPYEKRLSGPLSNYCSRNGDPIFVSWCRERGYGLDTAKINKDKLLTMAKNGLPKPKRNSKNKEERALANCLSSYISEKGESYDPVFDKELRKVAPHWLDSTLEKRQILENDYYKNGILPKGGSKEYQWHFVYHNADGPVYREEWSVEMKEKYPFLNDGPLDRSYKKMIQMMPANVKFGPNQEWKGTERKYIFIDEDFGKFKSTPDGLMNQRWPKGLTGHPKRGRARAGISRNKSIRCLENKKQYRSLKEAAKALEISVDSISNVLNGRQKTAGGYTFEYVEGSK